MCVCRLRRRLGRADWFLRRGCGGRRFRRGCDRCWFGGFWRFHNRFGNTKHMLQIGRACELKTSKTQHRASGTGRNKRCKRTLVSVDESVHRVKHEVTRTPKAALKHGFCDFDVLIRLGVRWIAFCHLAANSELTLSGHALWERTGAVKTFKADEAKVKEF